MECLIQEIESRKNELNESVDTIYFGGGTPSILSRIQLESILVAIAQNFQIHSDPEITIECNPDDLTYEHLNCIRTAGFNRLSVGIQTFDDEVLSWMNRSHNSKQALESIQIANELGFENISIDLIYGIPGKSLESWMSDLEIALNLPIRHVSAYCLTVEPRTALSHQVKKGEILPLDTDMEAAQFNMLVKTCIEKGFDQYEVSNFAKQGFISRHNSSYWRGQKYLGIGPSAHSFDGKSRSWNISNNAKYMKGVLDKKRNFILESLSKNERFNESLMTGLRTKWGVNNEELKTNLGIDLLDIYPDKIEKLVESGEMVVENEVLSLSTKGLLRADAIASDFFLV